MKQWDEKTLDNKKCLRRHLYRKKKCQSRKILKSEMCFSGLTVAHSPPPNRLSPHSRGSAICSKVLELTSLHLNFCDSCLFVGGEIPSLGENCIQSTLKGVFSNCFMIPTFITVLSVMLPQLLLRQRGICLLQLFVYWRSLLKKRRKKKSKLACVGICHFDRTAGIQPTLSSKIA